MLDQMAFMPHAIPGIVMAVAFLWVFINVDEYVGIPIYGGIWSVTIAFTVGYIAYGTRATVDVVQRCISVRSENRRPRAALMA